MARPKKSNTPRTELELDILHACEEMLAHVKGEKQFPTRYYALPEEVNVKEIRSNLHLTQEQFAHLIGASVYAVRHWENGRRHPDGTARTLLHVLQYNPHAVLDALAHPMH